MFGTKFGAGRQGVLQVIDRFFGDGEKFVGSNQL
jgi:hypothetical protein